MTDKLPQILLVDDDPSGLRLLERYTQQAGYQALTASSVRDALKLFDQHHPRIVVSDWLMPEIDGLEFCRQIRARSGDRFTFFMILSSNGDMTDVQTAMDAGVDDYLVKPLRRQQLNPRLQVATRLIELESQTEHRLKLESERNNLKESISSMEKVLGIVAHELRTPLVGIRTLSETLLMPEMSDPVQRENMIGGIRDESVRMAEMVNNLLEAARLDSGKARWNWESFDVSAPVEAAVQTAAAAHGQPGVDIRSDVTPGITMSGDSDAIRRLVLNLVANAAKFTTAGSVVVRASYSAIGELQLTVQDTGPGLTPDIAARLGEAFSLNAGVVGSGHVSGTGLGLSICRAIVAAHGGDVTFRTEIGKGTTFVARLRTDLDGPDQACRATQSAAITQVAA